jgi:hypothetical protein
MYADKMRCKEIKKVQYKWTRLFLLLPSSSTPVLNYVAQHLSKLLVNSTMKQGSIVS